MYDTLLLYNVKFQYSENRDFCVYLYRIFIYVSNWFLHRSFRWSTRLFFGGAFYPREKKCNFRRSHVRMLKFVYRISPRNERHCKARRKQNTLQHGLLFASRTNYQLPVSTRWIETRRFELRNSTPRWLWLRFQAERDATSDATFASRHCIARGKSFANNALRGGLVRHISLHCPQMQIYCYVAYIISSVRGDIFIRPTANQ